MKGHRQRLIEKFLQNSDSFEAVDLLELILFATNSRKNTRPIARLLMNQYKKLCTIAAAPVNELKQIEGLGEFSIIFLQTVLKMCEIMAKERVEKQKISNDLLIDYIRLMTQNKSFEIIYVAMLNVHNRVTSVEEVARGDNAYVNINIKHIVRLILNKDPVSVILIHNHPGGNVMPSNDDIENSKNIKRILANFNISLNDSLIVTPCGQSFSLLNARLI